MNRLPRGHSRWFIGLGVAIVSLATMVGGWAVLAAPPPAGPQPTPGPAPHAATTDDEWIAVIQEGKRRTLDPNTPWPEPKFNPGTRVVRSCTEVPPDAVKTTHATSESPDGSRRRMLIFYKSLTVGGFAFLIQTGWDTTGCSEELKRYLSEPDPSTKAINMHICEQMRIMAQGQPKTDVTLRDASPRVAQAYLEAFCQ